jgi:hypothetical protein
MLEKEEEEDEEEESRNSIRYLHVNRRCRVKIEPTHNTKFVTHTYARAIFAHRLVVIIDRC